MDVMREGDVWKEWKSDKILLMKYIAYIYIVVDLDERWKV